MSLARFGTFCYQGYSWGNGIFIRKYNPSYNSSISIMTSALHHHLLYMHDTEIEPGDDGDHVVFIQLVILLMKWSIG